MDVRDEIFEWVVPFIEKEAQAIRVAEERTRVLKAGNWEITVPGLPMWIAGAVYQQERLERVAEIAANAFEGDFVEIGSWLGETTVCLARAAQAFGRKVIVIDPYQEGAQNCGGFEYEFFQEQIKPFGSTVIHYRIESQKPDVIRMLAKTKIAFAFVDGLHTYRGALSDIRAVGHAGLIVVDDMNMAPVRLAMRDAELELARDVYAPTWLREAYL